MLAIRGAADMRGVNEARGMDIPGALMRGACERRGAERTCGTVPKRWFMRGIWLNRFAFP